MPRIEDIEQFNETLVQAGDEPEILAERGEDLEHVERPDEGLPGDLGDLLSEEGEFPEGGEAGEEDEEGGEELLSRLSEALDEEEEEGEESPAAEEGEEELSEEDLFSDVDLGGEDFDLPDDFGLEEEAAPEAPEEEGEAPAEELAEEPAPEEPEAQGEEPAEDIGDELDTEDEDFDLGDLDDFDFGDEEEGEPEEAPAEAEDEDFDIADLGDLEGELEEEAPAPEATEAPEAPEEPEEAEPDEEFGDELDEFTGSELGDLGDLGDEDIDLDADLADLAGGGEEGEEEEAAEAEPPEEEAPEESGGDELDLSAIEADFVDEEEEEEDEFELPEESLDEIAGGAEEEPETEPIPDDELPSFESEEEPDSEDDEFGDFGDLGDLEETDEEDFDVDEFNLDEFGTEFGVVEEAVEGLDAAQAEGGEEAVEGEVEGVGEEPETSLSEEEFDHLRRTLGALPLNLKREVEEIIAENKGDAAQTEELVRSLVDGRSPSQVAEIASRILGRKIQIPRGYQKRSGLAFEAEQRTFAYQFKHKILPVLRTVALVAVALGIIGYLSYQFIYQPLYARSLYTEGYEDVQADRYSEGNRKFDRAYEVWPRDPWFFRYAEAFIERRQYQLAVEKYDQLVFGMNENRRAFLMEQARQGNFESQYEINNRRRTIYEMINVDKEAILEHARLQSEVLANYERADSLLRILLHGDEIDYEALLARGDNYMQWAEAMETPEGRDDRYEEARLSYARLINNYGATDELLFRMLRYFIRTDNKPEVDRLTQTFQNNPDAEINPQIYAELAGYLIDKDDTEQIRDIIFRALDIDRRVPELHYQLARFYRTITTPGEELTALENARTLFEAQEPLTTEQLGMYIDTDIRLGEYYYGEEEYITSEEYLSQAQGRYERAIEQRLLQPDAKYGRLYAQRGDIYYFVERNFDTALEYYQEAEANEFESRPLDYRIGNIHYRAERYDQAVERFLDASGRVTRDKNLLWATGNALYYRDNYFAAQAHYEELLEQLQAERGRIQNLLVDENPRHRALIEQQIRANNNLGVALYQLYQRDATNQELLSEGLSYLTRAQEIAGNYSRDPETGERSLATNLAYLNTREILYPENQGTVQIYNQIPDALDSVNF